MTRKIISVVLSFCMIMSCFAISGISASAAGVSDSTSASAGEPTGSQYAQDTIGGSNVLHCFNWTYNNIKANLADIAEAGYTAVQTSPVQQPKDYSASYHTMSDEWWKMYQPLNLDIAEEGTTYLGSPDDLQELCEAADTYGIKVIVDIVANHLANNGTDGGGFSHVNVNVDPDLYYSKYFHSSTSAINYNSRQSITQDHLGMPDLNTGNSYIQQKVLKLLKDCVDLGVDGFRFDAAKHIEVPTDSSSFASDFWSTVINGIKAYKDDVYVYGEVLGSAGIDISNYTTYMSVTDDEASSTARGGVTGSNAASLASYSYPKGAGDSKSVLWVESHDTYMDGSTSSLTSSQITKTWAIVGARAKSTGLFLARPNATMGAASTDTTWKNTAVAEVNKFKNFFDGTSEYMASSGKVAYVERGTQGVVISNLGSSTSISVPAHQIADGTYTDQISGNTFTVSGGTISGKVGSTGVAVVYNPDDVIVIPTVNPDDTYNVYLKPNSNWMQANARFAVYMFNDSGNAWVDMTAQSDGCYKASIPTAYTNIIFCRMNGSTTTNSWDNKWNQTGDLTAQSGKCYVMRSGSWDTGDWTSYTEPTTAAATTAAPTTAAPTTAAPTTAAPTTVEPTTEDPTQNDFYLFGYINGANYACEEDSENLGTYLFENGTLTATFAQDSYVAVRTNNGGWFMANGYPGDEVTTATLYSTAITGENSNKLRVPGGVTVTFTLTDNGNDTYTLSYTAQDEPTTAEPTTAEPTTAAPTTKPADTITVYFTDALGWGSCKVYYWGGSVTSPAWPGVAMTKYEINKYNQQVYSAEVPAGATGIIFANGTYQTEDITENIADGAWWYTNGKTTTNSGGTTVYKVTFVEPEEPTTAEPTTVEPTTVEPTTVEPTTAPEPEVVDRDGVLIVADNFNLILNPANGTRVIGDIYLTAGEYKFRVQEDRVLMGYNTSFTDNTPKGLTFNSKFKSQTTLITTGGTYRFQYDTSANALIVKKADSTTPPAYLTGDLHTVLKPVLGKEDSMASGSIYVAPGTYKFKAVNGTSECGYNTVINDATDPSKMLSISPNFSSSMTLNATGGVYTFTLFTKTNKFKVSYVNDSDESKTDVHIAGDLKIVLDDNDGESNIATATATVAADTYQIKVYNYGVIYTLGENLRDSGTKGLKSFYSTPLNFTASGGTYTFTFNKNTGVFEVNKK